MFYFKVYKMNEIVDKFLLAGDKFMPQMHQRQPASLDKSEFTYSACGSFTKNKERIQKKKRKKREIQTISTKMNQIMPAFNTIWLMEILKIQQKAPQQIKF